MNRGANTMTYTKPAIEVLGKATVLIESSIIKTHPVILESLGCRGLTPAYDLDE
jgi:hypothetical protein